jgi:hypothetical protein
MQFTSPLTGAAATLARQYGETLARLPATVHAFILVELAKWPLLFAPEQASPASKPNRASPG